MNKFYSIEHAESFMFKSKNASALDLVEAATYLNEERIKLNLKEMELLTEKKRLSDEEYLSTMKMLKNRNLEFARQSRMLDEVRPLVVKEYLKS